MIYKKTASVGETALLALKSLPRTSIYMRALRLASILEMS